MNIFSDGGARGNPGPAAAAFVVTDEKGKVLFKDSKYLGKATNNVAEYNGVILALSWLVSETTLSTSSDIQFYLDSELVVKQLNNSYKVKDPDLKKLFDVVKNLQKKISLGLTFIHVPRIKNKLADFLVNEKLDANV